jgi:hypothetical protein
VDADAAERPKFVVNSQLDFCWGYGNSVWSMKAGSGGAMDQRVIIARLNIEHFRRKLAAEKHEGTRQTIIRLLAEEEAKLAALSDPPGEKKEEG